MYVYSIISIVFSVDVVAMKLECPFLCQNIKFEEKLLDPSFCLDKDIALAKRSILILSSSTADVFNKYKVLGFCFVEARQDFNAKDFP